jgi:hypothetical protein
MVVILFIDERRQHNHPLWSTAIDAADKKRVELAAGETVR